MNDKSRTLVVEFMSGPLDGQTVALVIAGEATIFILGRGTDCDIVIPYDGRVSRQHARLQVQGEAFFLEDSASRNGTYLDDGDQPLTGPTPLSPGTLFRIGRTRLRIQPPIEGTNA